MIGIGIVRSAITICLCAITVHAIAAPAPKAPAPKRYTIEQFMATVNIGGASNSTQELSRQIRHGLTKEDLAYYGGELKLNAGRLHLTGDTHAVALAHNHPSSVAEPSRADEYLTQTLKSALGLVDVRVIDHLIVAGDRVLSFAERGLL